MARPKKQPGSKKPHIVSYRLTDEEMAALRERAASAGRHPNEYARERAMREVDAAMEGRGAESGAPSRNRSGGEYPFEMVHELRRIGNNINQQTRLAHQNGALPPELKTLWADLQTILDRIIAEEWS